MLHDRSARKYPDSFVYAETYRRCRYRVQALSDRLYRSIEQRTSWFWFRICLGVYLGEMVLLVSGLLNPGITEWLSTETFLIANLMWLAIAEFIGLLVATHWLPSVARRTYRNQVERIIRYLQSERFVTQAVRLVLGEATNQVITQQEFIQRCQEQFPRWLGLDWLRSPRIADDFLYPLRTHHPDRIQVPEAAHMVRSGLYLFYPKTFFAAKKHIHSFSLYFWKQCFPELLWYRALQFHLLEEETRAKVLRIKSF